MAPDVTWCASPNFGPRRDGLTPTLVVLHYTAMASAQEACARLCDPGAEVSAHYLIDEKGIATQLVREEDRAWHAGAGEWHGQGDINSRSIGIELANRGTHPFPDPQMTSLEQLLRDIMGRWRITADGIIGHSDMAPGRKSDPGPHFDWARLARRGLARPAGDPAGQPDPDPKHFRTCARAAGYTADVDDDALLASVRLRFRPHATGPLAAADFAPLQLSRSRT